MLLCFRIEERYNINIHAYDLNCSLKLSKMIVTMKRNGWFLTEVPRQFSEEGMAFSISHAGKIVYQHAKINFDPYYTSYLKINSKWKIDLNIRTTTI